MQTARDVAEHILQKVGPITGLKLQKLVYYSQAWHLVWKESPLFMDPIEAWRNGPVVRELWEEHKGRSTISTVGGDAAALGEPQAEVVDQVLALYGTRPSEYLSSLTHEEYPWVRARRGLQPNDRGSTEVTIDSMAAFYENEPPGGRGMELHVSAEELEEIVAGQAELEHGEYITLEDLRRELQGPDC